MNNPLSRRSIVTGAVAVGTLAAASTLAHAKKPMSGTMPMPSGGMDHSRMDHSKMDHSMMHGEADFELTRDEERVVRALSACQSAGEVCLSLCIEMLGAGDTDMVACARSVRTMLAVCRAAQSLIQAHSGFAGQQLALCRDACSACQAECAKHRGHHEACRTCDNACQDAMQAIDRLLG
ncbi:MAG: hypothetical protein ABL973_12780 [Micropepsaceae bacterium]